MKMKEFFGTAGELPKNYSLLTAKFAVRRVKNKPLYSDTFSEPTYFAWINFAFRPIREN